MTEAEKFVPIRKLAESGFLTESRLRKMHKQGKVPPDKKTSWGKRETV